jgi:hypothetical protein
MKTNKRKNLLRIIAVVLILSLITPTNALAATPEAVAPLASDYLVSYTSYICPMGGGKLEIWFEVNCTNDWGNIGVLMIRLYESIDNSTWTQVKTFRHTNYPNMLDHNDSFHMDYVPYYGISGRYYKAYVTIWAGSDTVGDTRYIWTPVEKAY